MRVTVEKAVAMAGVILAIVARPTVLIPVPAMVVTRAPRLMPVAMIMAGMVVVRVGVFIACHWWGEYKSSPLKAPKRRCAGRLQRSRGWRNGLYCPAVGGAGSGSASRPTTAGIPLAACSAARAKSQ